MELMTTEFESFVIDNDKKADWALQKIAEVKAEYERIDAIAADQIAELQEKREDLKKSFESKTSFLKGKLAEYFETVAHKETKTQESYKLLSGSLIKKKPKVKLEKDDETLLAYFKANNLGEFIKTEEKPAWGDFKTRLEAVDGNVIDTETGEIVECVTVVETAPEFTVKL